MTDIEVGGIYRAGPMFGDAQTALVLVTAVDSAKTAISVTLLSPDIEFGTSVDVIVSRQDSGLGYELLAQSDICGYLWSVQLGRQLGTVSPTVLEALAALRLDDVVDRPVAGPPVVDRSDPRWSFKLEELKRLQGLTISKQMLGG